MARTPVLVLSVFLLATLAGCSKAPPSGTLPAGGPGVTLDGTVDLVYTAFSSGNNPLGVVPTAGGQLQCAQDAGAGTIPPQSPLQPCTPASTSVHAHFMALPQPEGEYHLWLANASGGMDLGTVMADQANMWDANKTLPEDYTGDFNAVQLRMDQFVLATASAAAGSQKFQLADGLSAISVKGTYKGKVLNVTVSGLPAAGSFVGRLYSKDPQSGLLSVAESFPVSNGANEFTAKVNVDTYAEFHIHVGTSLINLYKTTVAPVAAAPAK